MRIMVLCVGNICRSPYAAALLERNLLGVHVCSAGLQALIDHPADPLVQALAAEQGIDLSAHRGKQLLAQDLIEASVVLVMSESQQRDVVSRFPFARGRVFRLGEWIKQDIADPYRQSREFHIAVQQLIQQGVESWLPRLALINPQRAK